MTLDYYAYWNGAQLRDLFEAIVAITSGGDFAGLLKSAALAGFLVTITAALLKWQAMAAKTFIFALMLFYSVLFIPKVSVAIHDERAASVHVVDNVPFGIGFFAATASQIGHWLTEAFESGFAQSDAERFSKFGAVYPQRAISALQNAGLVTPEGRAKMTRFISGCVAPELLDHPEKANDLAASSNIWGDITANGWLNPARSVLSGEGKVLRCDEAAADLDQWIQNEELPEIKRRLGSRLVPDRLDPGSVIARTLPQAEALLLGLSRSLDTSLKHSIMLEALPNGIGTFAQKSGAPLQLAVNLSKAQGNLAREINYRSMSEIAKDALPKLRNAFEYLILASFPLVLVMILAAGSSAGIILRGFFTMVIWVQLWAPLSAVVNYLLITVDANPMNRIISEYGGNSLLAVDLIRSTGASSQALAGYLMLLVPVLAYALAKSSEIATASMIGSIMSPAQSASAGASSQTASGNISTGNVSMGNTSANNVASSKSDTSASFADPYSSKTQTAYGSVTRDGQGFVTGMSRTPIDLGVSSTASMQENKTLTQSSGTATTLSRSEAASLSISSGATGSDRAGADFSNALTSQLQKNLSTGQTWSNQESAGTHQTAATVHAGTESLQTSEGASHTSGMGLKVGVGGITAGASQDSGMASNSGSAGNTDSGVTTATGMAGSLGSLSLSNLAAPVQNGKGKATGKSVGVTEGGAQAQSGFTVQTAQSLVHTATGADITADANMRAQAYTQLRQASEQIAATTTDSGVASAARNFQAALDKAYRSSSENGIRLNSDRTASLQTQRGQTGQATASVNNDAAVMNRILSRSMSAEQGLENLQRSRTFREDAAIDSAVDNSIGTQNPHRFGPAQISGSLNGQREIQNQGRSRLAEQNRRAEQRVQGSDAQNREEIFRLQPQHNELPSREQIQNDFMAQKESNEQSLQSFSQETKQNAQSTANRSVNYQKEQRGLGTVASISLAGGIGYQGPRENKKED